MINDLTREIKLRSGEHIELCYHCHKCTAGCPVVQEMTFGPDRLLRMVAMDQVDDVLKSGDIWLCAGCYTCATRCPNDIDISAVMDALRQLAVDEGYPAGEPDAFLFHRLFLGVVERFGRSHEAAMLGLFKVLSKVPLMQDMDAGVKLLLRGKVPIIPEGTRAAGEVREIFRRSK
jgi:heterodisulfide reductase subunit C